MGARVTQAPLEVLRTNATATVRATQAPLEVLVVPAAPRARVTQAVLEVLVRRTTGGFIGEPGGGVW